MKQFIFFIVILSTGLFAAAQPCVSIIAPQLAENTKKEFEQKLLAARTDHEKDTGSADALIWYGRRTAYLGDYIKAIEIFTKGISIHPGDARLYRHRGHRYITVRCFDKAIADFKKAAALVKGKPDEIEPDGLPNAKNIPTSTLQSNIWYHLGLAYFLKGEYKKALKAYNRCLEVSANDDMKVATVNWAYLVLTKLGKTKKATDLHYTVYLKTEVIENFDYLKLVDNLYRDRPGEKEIDHYTSTMLTKNAGPLGMATINFGVGYYCLIKGYKEKAKEYFNRAIATRQWSSFGFIAAETELARMK